MRALALTALLLISGGDSDAPGRTPSRTFAVRCAKLYVGTGTVLEDATLIVVDGRVQAVGAGATAPEIPADMPVLDAQDRVVMPGIVLADTDLSGHGDAPYNVTPDFVALDGFDFVRAFGAALSGGVTSVYLSPGRNRLVSGQGSVVKLHGDDLVQRVLSEGCCLRIAMGEEATRSPELFEPTPSPTSDDPLLPARAQYPSARISILPVLREMFRDARAAEGAHSGDGTNGVEVESDYRGDGSGENHYSIAALVRTLSGEMPLRIGAKEPADVLRALQLGSELGSRTVLESPADIDKFAAQAAARGVAAVFRIPARAGASNPGGEDRKADGPRSEPEDPARAAAAGMRIAIAPRSTDDLPDTLLAAGIAIRHGLAPAQAMRALTSDAALILGVQDRVGSLEPGKDADFLVLSGEPFATGTLVEKTFVDGVPAYEREQGSDVLAIRAGEIWTMAGDTYRDGMIVLQDGRIKAVGPDRGGVPYGARVIDVPGGIVVPGFVDAYSHLGLSGEGSGIPEGAADQHIADVVQPDDPLLAEALGAGVTTALVSGSDSGTVSGRVAALKTGAADRASMVIKETAAIRLVYDGIGAEALQQLTAALDRGKKYLESWQKYEKALADFKAGKGPEPAEATPTEPAKGDPVSGTWAVELVESPLPVQLQITLVLKLEGTAVTGTVSVEAGGRGSRESEIEDGRFENGELTCRFSLMGDATLTAKVADDAMDGTITGGPAEMRFTAKRVAKNGARPAAPNGAVATDASGEPKKPSVDEALEPLRALFEKRIPAVIRTDRAPAVRSVVELFEKEQLPYVLTGVEDAVETPEILGESKPGVLLGPDVVQRDGGETTNAAAVLSDRGIAVALGTGDTAGARFLPLHAALAVRYGMDPTEALKAITIHAARMFKIDDRIGSLERGKDADLVVFSGNPLEMTSRVLLVVVDGVVVVDKRSEER